MSLNPSIRIYRYLCEYITWSLCIQSYMYSYISVILLLLSLYQFSSKYGRKSIYEIIDFFFGFMWNYNKLVCTWISQMIEKMYWLLCHVLLLSSIIIIRKILHQEYTHCSQSPMLTKGKQVYIFFPWGMWIQMPS